MRLTFIKPWGTYKVGDVLETTSKTTRAYLVDRYKVAKAETPKPIPPFVQDIEDVTMPKYFRRSPSNKMLKGPAKAKSVTEE